MKNHMRYSINTTDYLERYHSILNEMIAQMSSVELTGSISADFIRKMLPHHRAAIAMSENLLRYTTNIPLQNIALDIISTQKRSIENLSAAEEVCSGYTNTPAELTAYLKKSDRIIQHMFHEMRYARSTNSIDADFIREMIPHHEGAIGMSENARSYPICPELIPLLNEIIITQNHGVRQMQQLLRQIGNH